MDLQTRYSGPDLSFYDVKEDWANAKKRWDAWWNFDMYDRPLICAAAPKKNPRLPPELENFRYEEKDFVRKWAAIDYIAEKMLYEYYTTWYGGESVPVLKYGGSVGHALTFGCEPVFAKDTIWANPLPIKEGGEYPEIYFDENSFWWRKYRETVEKTAVSSNRRYFCSAKLGNHAGDNFSICRGSEALLCDLIENPRWVKDNLKYITDALIYQFEKLDELTPLTGLEGYVNTVDCWSPEKTREYDTDFSCMISPEHFKEIFLPPLIETMQKDEHVIYHLDGMAAMRNHLGALLAVDEINAFQWVPGDGHWEPMQWIPLLQEMQAHKKAVWCYAPPDAVIPVMKRLKPEGLCICTNAATEDGARRLVDEVKRLYG